MTAKTFKRGDKGAVAIKIINDNKKKFQHEVAALIADALDLPLARGVAYYRWYVLKGYTKISEPNVDPTQKRTKAVKEPKAPKAKKEKAAKAEKPKKDQKDIANKAMAALERARLRAGKAPKVNITEEVVEPATEVMDIPTMEEVEELL